MRRESTRDDAELSDETVLSKKNELEIEDETRLKQESNTAEASPNSGTRETGTNKLSDTDRAEEELVLKRLSRAAVSSKPGGAWAAGPPSGMLHESNLEGGETAPQYRSSKRDTIRVATEFSKDKREKQLAGKLKQENGHSKEHSQVNGSAKSSPVLSNVKETTPRPVTFVEKESPSNSNTGQLKSGAFSSSWPVPEVGVGGQQSSVIWWPGAGPNTSVSDSQRQETCEGSNTRESKNDTGDTNLGAEVGTESPKLSPYMTYMTNGYQSMQYPFHSYPSPYMPMQNMFVPPWYLYPYAPPIPMPRPPNVFVNNSSSGYSYDVEQQRDSTNAVNKGDYQSFQPSHRGNVSNGGSPADILQSGQEGMEKRNTSKITSREESSVYNGNEKSPKRSSTTNGKNISTSIVSSPPPFGNFQSSFERSQSMAAFYSPWPIMAPPFFWFPDPRMIDPHQTVTETALYVHQRVRPTRDESIRKASLFRHLYKLCQNEWKHCDLWMFGSSINSFGLRSGDLDMCLTVPPEDAIHRVTGEHLDERHIVNRLGVILRQAKMENVECRFRARVPIVKFHDPLTRLSVDVCINNKLARHNSALLRTYASLDPRVQILGLLIKYWAKCRGINQPFTGTLSSYAYILLLIQFLQARNRPLLPCLQQSVGGRVCTADENIPRVIVDNCNVYFDTCITGYTSLLSGSNSESIGLLLTEFFGFYAYTFDYSKHVVSVRCGRLLTREEKSWFVPPVDARIEESEEEDEHVSLDSQLHMTSRSDPHLDIFPHDMDAVVEKGEEPHDKVSQKAVSDGEESKRKNSTVLSPKMPVMNILRMPKRHKRFKELHVFCIEDPFDTSHDIGRVVDEDSLEVLREEFIRAYEIIRTTGNFLEVCRPYEAEKTS